MFHKILVPTDVSDTSRKALDYALEIAKKYNSEVELFHVTYTAQAYWGYAVSYGILVSQEQLDESGEAALEAALTGIDVGDVNLTKKHISGHPATAIVEESKNGFDLIVMGSHGHGPISGVVLGSVAQRVLAHANCPVLVVRANENP